MGCFCSKEEELVERKNVYIVRKTYSMKLRRSVRAKLRPSVFAMSSECMECTLAETGDKTYQPSEICTNCGKYSRTPFQD